MYTQSKKTVQMSGAPDVAMSRQGRPGAVRGRVTNWLLFSVFCSGTCQSAIVNLHAAQGCSRCGLRISQRTSHVGLLALRQ